MRCSCGLLMFARSEGGPESCIDCDHGTITIDRRYVWPAMPLDTDNPLRDTAIRAAGGLINLDRNQANRPGGNP